MLKIENKGVLRRVKRPPRYLHLNGFKSSKKYVFLLLKGFLRAIALKRAIARVQNSYFFKISQYAIKKRHILSPKPLYFVLN